MSLEPACEGNYDGLQVMFLSDVNLLPVVRSYERNPTTASAKKTIYLKNKIYLYIL